MDQYQTLIQTLALTMGVSWASGLNLYAVLVVLGLGGATGNIALPHELDVVQNPLVIGSAALMYCVEFFADKVPGVDSGWDALHTFIRIPAGAMLAAGAVGDVSPALQVAAGLLGGSMTAATHATKASTRALINTSPEPFTNWTASIAEDLAVFGGLWTALAHPTLFLALLAVFVVLMILILPRLWRGLRAILRKIGQWVGLSRPAADAAPPAPSAAARAREVVSDHLGQLERLKSLLDAGALTDEEFTLAKRRVLDDGSPRP